MYGFRAVPLKIPTSFFAKMKKKNPDIQISVEWHETPSNQDNLGKEEQSGRLTLTSFKTYSKATVIKTV